MKLDKQRKRIKQRSEHGHYQGKHGYVSAISSVYRKELAQNATKAELIVREFLKDNEVKHKFQKTFIMPFHRIVDFYIPKKKIIIEVDGGYHLNIVEKDLLKDKLWLEKRGCKTIRITNEQVYSGEFQQLLFLDVICG
jgi:very-short-patch-repair endonuclease